jgi:hypothetical protein
MASQGNRQRGVKSGRVLPKERYADILPARVHGQQSGGGEVWPSVRKARLRTGSTPARSEANSAGDLSPRPRSLHQRRARAVWRAGRLRVGMGPARRPRAQCKAGAPGKALVLAGDARWHCRQKTGPTARSGRRLIVIQAASLPGKVGVVRRHPRTSSPIAWPAGRSRSTAPLMGRCMPWEEEFRACQGMPRAWSPRKREERLRGQATSTAFQEEGSADEGPPRQRPCC